MKTQQEKEHAHKTAMAWLEANEEALVCLTWLGFDGCYSYDWFNCDCCGEERQEARAERQVFES